MRKGSHHTPEAREKIRLSHIGKSPTLGYRFTDSQKKKMSESRRRWMEENPAAWKALLDRLAKHAALRRMAPSEKAAINKTRYAAKRFVRRVLTMTRKRKDATTEALLGYTKRELRAHLEGQFKDGMSWENRGSFHIDHIFPVAEYLRLGITDMKVINALSNLQVLTPFENQSKSDSIDAAGTRQGIA